MKKQSLFRLTCLPEHHLTLAVIQHVWVCHNLLISMFHGTVFDVEFYFLTCAVLQLFFFLHGKQPLCKCLWNDFYLLVQTFTNTHFMFVLLIYSQPYVAFYFQIESLKLYIIAYDYILMFGCCTCSLILKYWTVFVM